MDIEKNYERCEYYENYIGPPIKLSYIEINGEKQDITDIMQKIYGENFNRNGRVCRAKTLEIPNIIGSTLYIEFDNPNNIKGFEVVDEDKGEVNNNAIKDNELLHVMDVLELAKI